MDQVTIIKRRHKKLIGFVLDKMASEPVGTRIDLYCALAEVCGDGIEAERMRGLASELGKADCACMEFNLSFKERNRDPFQAQL